MDKYIIGIDNGVSGSVGCVHVEGGQTYYYKIPVKKQLNYTKTKKWINRIDVDKLKELLQFKAIEIVYLERPMVNPGRFQATASALRALEATLIVIESLKLSYAYIDSKEWQSVLLPKELKGDELKTASLDIGKRLFPTIDFKGFKDADGLLIAEYGKRKVNKNERD
jgi:hypothetical protein